MDRMLKTGYNFIKMSQRILSTIIAVSICLSCFAVDLSAQENKDDKKWEITAYLGTAQLFYVPCVGMGVEYFITPRISLEGEINYLSHYAFVSGSASGPWTSSDKRIMENEIYRLLWDINLLFYFDITKVKRPAMRWFITVGTGYQYDRVEYIFISLVTLEQHKYGYGEFRYQGIPFGVGYKVNIKRDWELRVLFKIHRFPADETQTGRIVLGLGYKF